MSRGSAIGRVGTIGRSVGKYGDWDHQLPKRINCPGQGSCEARNSTAIIHSRSPSSAKALAVTPEATDPPATSKNHPEAVKERRRCIQQGNTHLLPNQGEKVCHVFAN